MMRTEQELLSKRVEENFRAKRLAAYALTGRTPVPEGSLRMALGLGRKEKGVSERI